MFDEGEEVDFCRWVVVPIAATGILDAGNLERTGDAGRLGLANLAQQEGGEQQNGQTSQQHDRLLLMTQSSYQRGGEEANKRPAPIREQASVEQCNVLLESLVHDLSQERRLLRIGLIYLLPAMTLIGAIGIDGDVNTATLERGLVKFLKLRRSRRYTIDQTHRL